MVAPPIICENKGAKASINIKRKEYIKNDKIDINIMENMKNDIEYINIENLSQQDQEQFERIQEILTHIPVNVNSLRNIAHHGFISKEVRRHVWPLLIGIGKEDVLHDLNVPSTIDINSPYYDQINKDIIRSCCHFDVNIDQTEEETNWLRKNLARQLHSFFGSHANLHYIQGFHDIASIVMFLCMDKYIQKQDDDNNNFNDTIIIDDKKKQYYHKIYTKNKQNENILIIYRYDEALAYTMMKRLALSYLKDSLCSTLDRVTQMMQLLFPLIGLADEQVGEFLDESCVNFAFSLPWILTWMAHNIKKLDEVCLVFDLLLSSHPLMSLYFCAAAILLHKDEMLQLEPDTCTVHQFMQHMPEHLNIRITLLLCRVLWITYPPDILLGSQQSEVGKPHDVNIELPKDSPLYFRTPADIITYIHTLDTQNTTNTTTNTTNETFYDIINNNSNINQDSTTNTILHDNDIPINKSLSKEIWGDSIDKNNFTQPLTNLPSCNDIIMENGEQSSVMETEEVSTITDVNSDVYTFGQLFPQLQNALYEDERFIPLLHSIHTSYNDNNYQSTKIQFPLSNDINAITATTATTITPLQRILYSLFPIQDPYKKEINTINNNKPLRDIRDFTSAILAFPVLLSYLFSNQLLLSPEIRDVAQRSAVSHVNKDVNKLTNYNSEKYLGNTIPLSTTSITTCNESSGALLWNPYLLKAKITNSEIYDIPIDTTIDTTISSSLDDKNLDINLPTSNSGQNLEFVVKPRPISIQSSIKNETNLLYTVLSTVSYPLQTLWNLLPNSVETNHESLPKYVSTNTSKRTTFYIAGIIGGVVAQYIASITTLSKKGDEIFSGSEKLHMTFSSHDETP